MTKVRDEAMANSVPAAAVIQRWQPLFGITGLKAHVGGKISRSVKSHGSTVDWQPILSFLRPVGESGIPGGAVKCVDIRRNVGGVGDSLDRF